jgi:sporulation protein YlmC with PRC-barrel domain
MAKFAIAKQMAGKRIITSSGEEVGRLLDLLINEVTGRVETLVVEPNLDSKLVQRVKRDEGMILLPYNAVMAVGDHLIVDRKGLGA